MALRVPKAELSESMIKQFGVVPEPVEVTWHNPKVAEASLELGGKVSEWHPADESLKSFAHMAVAVQVGCSFCLDVGYFQAQNQDLDMAKASQVPRWREQAQRGTRDRVSGLLLGVRASAGRASDDCGVSQVSCTRPGRWALSRAAEGRAVRRHGDNPEQPTIVVNERHAPGVTRQKPARGRHRPGRPAQSSGRAARPQRHGVRHRDRRPDRLG